MPAVACFATEGLSLDIRRWSCFFSYLSFFSPAVKNMDSSWAYWDCGWFLQLWCRTS